MIKEESSKRYTASIQGMVFSVDSYLPISPVLICSYSI